MNRGYHVEDYIEAVREIRKAYPPIHVKTQIMVGFPGETDEDFKKSMGIFKLGLFDYVEVYAYTKRPRTMASQLTDEIPDKIKTKRYRKLLFKAFLQLPFKRIVYMLKRKMTNLVDREDRRNFRSTVYYRG